MYMFMNMNYVLFSPEAILCFLGLKRGGRKGVGEGIKGDAR